MRGWDLGLPDKIQDVLLNLNFSRKTQKFHSYAPYLRKMETCPHRILYMSVQNGRWKHSLKVETAQMSAVQEKICTRHMLKIARQTLFEPL